MEQILIILGICNDFLTIILLSISAISTTTLLCLLSLTKCSLSAQPNELYAWKHLDYDWLDNELKEEALKSGAYVPENNLPMGFAPWNDKIFISVPRFKTGVPSTLNYITLNDGKYPSLIPYPSWEVNTLPSENDIGQNFDFKDEATDSPLSENYTIASVFRIWIDNCDRLWALDVGNVDTMGSQKEISKPSLLIYDIHNDVLLRRSTFKIGTYCRRSFFGHIAVDVNPKYCENTFAYITDIEKSKLIVYSMKDDDYWHISHHYFNFDPLAGQYNIAGTVFQWTDGIVGLALSDIHEDGTRTVYFHATSSTKEFEVSNKVLQNETWATNPNNFYDFKLLGERGPKSQATASVYDESSNILIYTQIQRNGLGCWNSKKHMTPETANLFVSDLLKLQFPSDIKIREGKLWILSNKLQRYIYRSLNLKEINFRILRIPIQDVVSICV